MPPEAVPKSSASETASSRVSLQVVSPYTRQTFSPATVAYFDRLAENPARWRRRARNYYRYTIDFLKHLIPENQSILMVGCPDGEILRALKPSRGVGLHLSARWTEELKRTNTDPNVSFVCASPDQYESRETFDYVVLLNQLDACEDILALLDSVRPFLHEQSRLVLSRVNPVWHPLIRITSLLGLRVPDYRRTAVSNDMIQGALAAKGYHYQGEYNRVLFPRRLLGLSWLINTYLARFPFVNRFCFMKYTFAKLSHVRPDDNLTCSVIIPCYNEAGNIRECATRVPRMGKHTEVVIVDDGSKDDTVKIARELEKTHPHIRLIACERNQGKGKAVARGMAEARGDILFILDADMTVPPEELPDAFDAFRHHAADFVLGTRFVYPMEKRAMRAANYVGNILFAKLMQIILGTPCTDTLCGTKVMRRRDFEDMKIEESSWGDFDFIFHAGRKKLKSIEIPFHYKSRTAGESKMKALSAGTRFLLYCLRKWHSVP